VKAPRKMLQHTTSERYFKGKAKIGKEKNLYQRSVLKIDKDTKYMSLHPDIISYRAYELITAAKSNIPITTLMELSSDRCDKFSGYTFRRKFDIVRVIAPTVLKTTIDDLYLFNQGLL